MVRNVVAFGKPGLQEGRPHGGHWAVLWLFQNRIRSGTMVGLVSRCVGFELMPWFPFPLRMGVIILQH